MSSRLHERISIPDSPVVNGYIRALQRLRQRDHVPNGSSGADISQVRAIHLQTESSDAFDIFVCLIEPQPEREFVGVRVVHVGEVPIRV